VEGVESCVSNGLIMKNVGVTNLQYSETYIIRYIANPISPSQPPPYRPTQCTCSVWYVLCALSFAMLGKLVLDYAHECYYLHTV